VLANVFGSGPVSGSTASAFALSTNSGGSARAISVMTMRGRRVDRDPPGTQFPRQGLRQADQARLRGAVVRLPELPRIPLIEVIVDDRPYPAFRIDGASARITWNAPVRLTERTDSTRRRSC